MSFEIVEFKDNGIYKYCMTENSKNEPAIKKYLRISNDWQFQDVVEQETFDVSNKKDFFISHEMADSSMKVNLLLYNKSLFPYLFSSNLITFAILVFLLTISLIDGREILLTIIIMKLILDVLILATVYRKGMYYDHN